MRVSDTVRHFKIDCGTEVAGKVPWLFTCSKDEDTDYRNAS
jgi:hypothetical protein